MGDAIEAAEGDADVALEILLKGTIEEHTSLGSAPQTRQHLRELMSIEVSQRLKGIKSFYEICSKLMDNLDNPNYGNLNYKAVCTKFEQCMPCVQLLQDAGFVKSADGRRLQFDPLYIKNLSSVMQQMSDMV